MTEVAIIGAGPYGLSVAAKLRAAGVPFRIFGPPMHFWRTGMPTGMHLKSDGFASDLYDADRQFTLKHYCGERGISYDDRRIPVLLETFIEYGQAFQAKLVPTLDEQLVEAVKAVPGGFELRLQSGETLRARRVVLASGISHFGHVPPPLNALGPQLCTHSSAHRDLSGFSGKDVVVVGGGSSAVDIAALLHVAGARATIVARHPVIFSDGPSPDGRRPLWQRLRRPHLGLGSSLRSSIYTLFPDLFHFLPRKTRLRIVRRHLGPFAGYFVRPMIEGKVPIKAGYSLKSARVVDGRVDLQCVNATGAELQLQADHVIAATGYRVQVSRLGFLDEGIRSAVTLEDESESPLLSSNFESSVPGLYFIGVAAANSFGPLLRFALGAGFSSTQLVSHLVRVSKRDTKTVLPAGQRQSAD
jgi:thioredoxin reductase